MQTSGHRFVYGRVLVLSLPLLSVSALVDGCVSSDASSGPDASAPAVDSGPSDQDGSGGRPSTDAGSEAGGAEGGQDAAPDAGQDSGDDAGRDAGQDSGQDAGQDSGQDAGQDAADAGPPVAHIAAYALANDSSSASYTPTAATSYNSTGGGITAARSATGTYTMTFSGLTLGAGDVQVTAYNSNSHCAAGSQSGSTISILCYDPTNALVDSRYTVAVVLNDVPTTATVSAYALASLPISPSYTPSGTYSYNAGGGGITATRSATGVYAITFAGLTIDNGDVQVTSSGNAGSCNVASWSGATANVRCWDRTGAALDSNYNISVITTTTASSTASPRAYAWANDGSSASYTPNSSYSYPAGAAILASRTATGTYSIQFTGVSLNAGTVLATPYNSSARCNIVMWGSNDIGVRCYDAAGTLVDSSYNVIYFQ